MTYIQTTIISKNLYSHAECFLIKFVLSKQFKMLPFIIELLLHSISHLLYVLRNNKVADVVKCYQLNEQIEKLNERHRDRDRKILKNRKFEKNEFLLKDFLLNSEQQ